MWQHKIVWKPLFHVFTLKKAQFQIIGWKFLCLWNIVGFIVIEDSVLSFMHQLPQSWSHKLFNLTTMRYCVDWWNMWWSKSDSNLQIKLILPHLIEADVSCHRSRWAISFGNFLWNPPLPNYYYASACEPNIVATFQTFHAEY